MYLFFFLFYMIHGTVWRGLCSSGPEGFRQTNKTHLTSALLAAHNAVHMQQTDEVAWHRAIRKDFYKRFVENSTR